MYCQRKCYHHQTIEISIHTLKIRQIRQLRTYQLKRNTAFRLITNLDVKEDARAACPKVSKRRLLCLSCGERVVPLDSAMMSLVRVRGRSAAYRGTSWVRSKREVRDLVSLCSWSFFLCCCCCFLSRRGKTKLSKQQEQTKQTPPLERQALNPTNVRIRPEKGKRVVGSSEKGEIMYLVIHSIYYVDGILCLSVPFLFHSSKDAGSWNSCRLRPPSGFFLSFSFESPEPLLSGLFLSDFGGFVCISSVTCSSKHQR